MDVSRYAGIVFDLDGVLWHGSTPLPGAVEAVNHLHNSGKKILYLTNNGGRHHASLAEKLSAMGYPATADNVVNSGYATAQFLRRSAGRCQVHVMGTDELRREMQEAGHEVVERGASHVVAAIDRSFTFDKLDLALQNLLYDDSIFVACNEDPRFPVEGRFMPGAGSLVQALATCAGRQPDLVIGKPHRPIMDIALSVLGLNAQQCLIVGDSLGTDIRAGNDVGAATVLVLTGNAKREDIAQAGVSPTFIVDSVCDLVCASDRV